MDIVGILHAAGWCVRVHVRHGREIEHRSSAFVLPTFWATHFRTVPNLCVALDPSSRREIVAYISMHGGVFATPARRGGVLSPRSTIAPTALLEDGNAVGPFACVGNFAIIMSPVSIGHDSSIGDFVTIGSAVGISGFVNIEGDVVVESGATVLNGTATRPLCIGRGARIRPHAVVTRSVARSAVVAGNPAKTVPPR